MNATLNSIGIKQTMKTAILFCSISLFLAGCGENLQSVYSGTAQLKSNDCPGANGVYTIDVNASVGGNTVRIELASAQLTSGSDGDQVMSRLQRLTPFTTDLESDTDFSIQNQLPANQDEGGVSSSGTLDLDRSAITNFELTGKIHVIIEARAKDYYCTAKLSATSPLKVK